MASGECVLICKQKKFGSKVPKYLGQRAKKGYKWELGQYVRKYINYLVQKKYHQPLIKRPATYIFKKDPALKTDIKSAKRQYGLVPLPLSSDIDLAKN